jgi:hypothetical protein
LTLLYLMKSINKSDNISKANPKLGWNFCEHQLGEKTSWVPFLKNLIYNFHLDFWFFPMKWWQN